MKTIYGWPVSSIMGRDLPAEIYQHIYQSAQSTTHEEHAQPHRSALEMHEPGGSGIAGYDDDIRNEPLLPAVETNVGYDTEPFEEQDKEHGKQHVDGGDYHGEDHPHAHRRLLLFRLQD